MRRTRPDPVLVANSPARSRVLSFGPSRSTASDSSGSERSEMNAGSGRSEVNAGSAPPSPLRLHTGGPRPPPENSPRSGGGLRRPAGRIASNTGSPSPSQGASPFNGRRPTPCYSVTSMGLDNCSPNFGRVHDDRSPMFGRVSRPMSALVRQPTSEAESPTPSTGASPSSFDGAVGFGAEIGYVAL